LRAHDRNLFSDWFLGDSRWLNHGWSRNNFAYYFNAFIADSKINDDNGDVVPTTVAIRQVD
jgi:hypothetical protein